MPKKKLTKREEFPNINWDDLADADVQKAELIYSDRVNTYKRLAELDATIDDNPTKDAVTELAEKTFRNRICSEELFSFNKKGKWLNKHPIFNDNQEHKKLTQLLLQNPDGFMTEYNAVKSNIVRYTSYLKSKKYSEEQHERQKTLIEKYTEKESVMSEILKNNIYDRRSSGKQN